MYRHAHRYAAVAMLLAAVLVKPTAAGKAVGEEAGVLPGLFTQKITTRGGRGVAFQPACCPAYLKMRFF